MADKIKMSDIRAQFPMYSDLSDEQLLIGLRQKYYPDIKPGDFYSKVDFDTERARLQQENVNSMSGFDKFRAGMGKAFTDVVRGAGQLIGVVDRSEIDESKKLDSALMGTGAGVAGNIAGNVAAFAPTALIPGANTVTGAALAGAGMGALQPVGEEDSRLGNMALGGVLGGGTVLAVRGAKAGYEGAKALVEPFTASGRQRIAGRTLERFAADPNAVRAASGAPTVTGATPTLAEAARDPGIASLQRALEASDPQIAAMLGERFAANNAARVAALSDIAGDPARLGAAEQARREATEALYQAATSQSAPRNAAARELLARPSVQQAKTRAARLAAEKGAASSLDEASSQSVTRNVSFKMPDSVVKVQPSASSVTRQVGFKQPDTVVRAGEGGVPRVIEGATGSVARTVNPRSVVPGEGAKRAATEVVEGEMRNVSRTVNPRSVVPGEGAGALRELSGADLQRLKMALDSMLSDPASGIAGAEAAAVRETRDALVNFMEQNIPEFAQARTTYSTLSKPINQMQVGQRLLDTTTAAIRDMSGNRKLQANAFARALNNEEALVRKATDFKGVNALADVMTPGQMQTLNAVRNELELAANLAQAANGPGSQTAKTLASQNLLRRILGPTGAPESWAESALLTNLVRPVQFAYGTAEPAIQNQLAEILLNPDLARAAMVAAQPTQRQLPATVNALLPYATSMGRNSVPATGLVTGQR